MLSLFLNLFKENIHFFTHTPLFIDFELKTLPRPREVLQKQVEELDNCFHLLQRRFSLEI